MQAFANFSLVGRTEVEVIDGETGEIYFYPNGVDACMAARRESKVSPGPWLVMVGDGFGQRYVNGEYDGKVK